MKTRIHIPLACLLVISQMSQGQVVKAPETLSYQGRILLNNQPFEGQGYFVFALYESGTLIWTNKYPVASPLNDPAGADMYDAMQLKVRNGFFSVRLGDGENNNRPVISEAFFKSEGGLRRARSNLRMEVWFSPAAGSSFTKLSPDIDFTSVPFAHVATLALSIKGLFETGTVVPFAGSTAPEGWVLCDGKTYAAQDADFSRLADVVGTAFNTGDEPAGHFRVPDMRGRTAIGSGKGDTWSGAGGATTWVRGTRFGSEKHILTEAEMPSHNHGVTDPLHTHPVNDPGHTHEYFDKWQHDDVSDDSNDLISHYLEVSERRQTSRDKTGVSIVSGTTGISIQSKGNNLPHNIMQPISVLNYIIKL